MSTTDVVKAIDPELPMAFEECECTEFSMTEMLAMLAERREFGEAKYRAVAWAVGAKDWASLTRRNASVYHLENANEHNARIELGRLIHQRAIPTDTPCLREYLLNGIATDSLPGRLRDIEVAAPQGWLRILNSLCPAGLSEIRGDDCYVIVEPSTEEAIARTKSRLSQLLICKELLFDDEEVGSFARRKVVAKHMRPMLGRMRSAKTFEDYIDADIDWQLELAGGDYEQYQHMLIATRSYRFSVEHLDAVRHGSPRLKFQPGFDMDHRAWRDKMMSTNTECVARLQKLLQVGNATELEVTRTLTAIVEQTLVQLRALDNAREAARGTRSDKRRYAGLEWPRIPDTQPNSGSRSDSTASSSR